MSAQPSMVPSIIELQKRLVADAVVMLQRASLIRGGMLANDRIGATLGLTAVDLADAAQRVAHRAPGPLLGHHGLSVVPERPTTRPTVVPFGRDGRPKNPTPDTRRCCHCDTVKSITEFRVMRLTKSGNPKYKSFCLPCEAIYQKARYLSVKMLDQLGQAGVAFTADQTMVCSICTEPIAIGTQVVVHGQAMHAHHPEATSA